MGEKLSEGPSSQENIISRLCCLKISKKRGLSRVKVRKKGAKRLEFLVVIKLII